MSLTDTTHATDPDLGTSTDAPDGLEDTVLSGTTAATATTAGQGPEAGEDGGPVQLRGPGAATAAALDLVHDGHHVHIVASGDSQCQTADCPTEVVGGLRIDPRF